MPAENRPFPTIPDHEVLRKIGGGAYGEVWLARGVTGALRAVKVVWRQDFEDERGFEREFEGILKFEPISRDHPALVNILHVGRSADGVSFYYYVMELGDDVSGGREINPVEYEPRTLRADHPHAGIERWNTAECLDVGLRLAEALDHLHQHGLAHRDVKPSNIIFVNGRAKLADIGLVAARGQRTFVGTEGFVPPEGPGSAQADIYSLGKVLYEMATGKDRMNFPELPDEMPQGAERRPWLELNRVICDVCEPRVSHRAITTAAQLAEALRRIGKGQRGRRSTALVWAATVVLTGFSGWATWQVAADAGWFSKLPFSMHRDPTPAIGQFRIFSTPEGADVIDPQGVLIGTTPTPTLTAEVGTEVVFTLRKKDYQDTTVRERIGLTAANEPMVIPVSMKPFQPPVTGEWWEDHFGNRYQPVENHHLSEGFVDRATWDEFIADGGAAAGGETESLSYSRDGTPVNAILVTAHGAEAFCQWLRTAAIHEGRLTEEFELRALREQDFDHPSLGNHARQAQLKPFRVMVRRFNPGSLTLTSDPAGAEVYLNGQYVGTTDSPLDLTALKPGSLKLLLVLQGYKPLSKTIKLGEGGSLRENLKLQKNESVVFGRPWENGIKMRFVPVNPDLMASAWETRLSDFALFVTETGRRPPPPPPFAQEPDHPVINVSRKDARAFCDWLTRREREQERIGSTHQYRLPTDLEWSMLVGLEDEGGISPGWRDARKRQVFPWGIAWPPRDSPGNFADDSAASAGAISVDRTIPGYEDGYPFTAPVGSFTENPLGIHDLSGNVQEWVDDEYSRLGNNVLGVLRGGGWNTYQPENLYTGSRNAVPPDYRDIYYGFRIVLAKIPRDAD
ncbi:MAG: SUMF1/EgtB/PvdO family nonheme iron enzyme [Luteolibacter sp.]